jgi:hypothetical protein
MSEVDDLYSLTPGEFTRARNALAARLKKDGREEEADAVRSLRRPSVALWAVNQVARRDRDAVERLVELGEELREAQIEGRAADFRRATRERSSALRRLADQLETILEEAGAARSHRATQIVEAATADEEARRFLLNGALRTEIEPAGFGEIFGALPEEPPTGTTAEPAAEEARRKAHELMEKAREARRKALRLEREADEAEARARSARRAAARAVEAAEKAESEAEAAEQRTDELLG